MVRDCSVRRQQRHRSRAEQEPPFIIVAIDVQWASYDGLLVLPEILRQILPLESRAMGLGFCRIFCLFGWSRSCRLRAGFVLRRLYVLRIFCLLRFDCILAHCAHRKSRDEKKNTDETKRHMIQFFLANWQECIMRANDNSRRKPLPLVTKPRKGHVLSTYQEFHC